MVTEKNSLKMTALPAEPERPWARSRLPGSAVWRVDLGTGWAPHGGPLACRFLHLYCSGRQWVGGVAETGSGGLAWSPHLRLPSYTWQLPCKLPCVAGPLATV